MLRELFGCLWLSTEFEKGQKQSVVGVLYVPGQRENNIQP